MKPIHEFLAELDQQQIKFKLEGEQLRIRAPQQALPLLVTDQLRLRKDEILHFLRQQPAKPKVPALQATARPARLPLSYAQERLWFFAALEGASATYNIPFALRLWGSLDQSALSAALNAIVQRHEALRTTFVAVDGVAQQIIVSHYLAVALPLIDLSKEPESDRESAVQRQLTEAAAQPFDLAVGPLLRATLYRLAEQEHILLLTLHHIIADGWSLGILLRELDACYCAHLAGEALPLPPLPHQYADFALWQRQWLQGDLLQAQLSWWQQQLADVPTLLDLPTDYQRPAVQRFRGNTVSFTLDAALTAALDALSRQHGASLFMTLYAAFAVLLRRYSGQEDIVIGTPIANRHHSGLEPLIGLFVNTLPLRADLRGNPAFVELLQRVRQMTLDAYAHQDLPFEQVVNHLPIARSLSHSPLFQVMMTLDTTPEKTAAVAQPLGDLTANRVELESGIALVDLTLELVKTGDTIKGWLDYDRDLFDAATVTRVVAHFQELLQAIVANPEQTIAQLPLLTAAERQQILGEWNHTVADYPQDTRPEPVEGKCIHHLFEEQAARMPDAVAVVLGDQQLTYNELNERSNQLARHLQSLGVGAGMLVGLCVEPAPEMVVGMLGIMKAGGAYLPLDPASPQERLAWMLEDAAVAILLTQSQLRAHLPPMTARIICLDRDWTVIAEQSRENPRSLLPTDTLAYAIYTSGSTGKPKGVLVPHRGLVNLACWHRRAYAVTPADRATQLASLNFDAAVWEIWPYLTAGATLQIVPSAIRGAPTELHRWLLEQAITICFAVPLMAEQLLALPWPADGAMRMFLTGGDRVRRAPANSLPFPLINNYGPTENSVIATSGVIPCDGAVGPAIGRPIDNVQVYILDAHEQPTPIGVAGELHIGGVGLAQGYLNQPALTAEKFIANPLGAGLLYKTGDRVRWMPDGNIEFLGRTDHQVKLRGFRIELGEIEAVLRQHPTVQEAVVVLHNAESGEPRLVAYVVGDRESMQDTISLSDLRDYLRQKLPDHMIPSSFMALDALPLNSSGKIDRKALPAPDVRAATSYARPRTFSEEKLAAIWREALQVAEVGIHDNFFELGGHSLLAVRLLAQIRQVFDRPLPLPILFQYPTVAALAAYLEQGEPLAWSTLAALQPEGESAPFFCAPGGGGNVFYFYPLIRALGKERPFYGLESAGLDGRMPPHTTVEAAAAYQLAEVKRRFPQGPYLLGGHSFGGLVAFEMAQQLLRAGETVGALVILDADAPPVQLPPLDDVDLILIYERLFTEEYGYPAMLSREELAPLSSEEGLLRLQAVLEQIGALPAGNTVADIQNLFNVFQTNYQTNYTPQAVIPLPIQLFVVEDQPPERSRQMIDGWAQWGNVVVHSVPGTHTTMTYDPHVQTLAQKLAACLTAADGGSA